MTSRRLIASSETKDLPMMRLQQGLAFDGMGSGRVRGSNFEMPMSAMGQKQTLPWHFRMSALPPKADIRIQSREIRFVPKVFGSPPVAELRLRRFQI
jgi:hypothetical protein